MFHRPNTSGISAESTRLALDSMKYEIAKELGIDLQPGHQGELPSRAAGYMVKRMIEQQEKAMNHQKGTNR